jgi:hypothetical protein
MWRKEKGKKTNYQKFPFPANFTQKRGHGSQLNNCSISPQGLGCLTPESTYFCQIELLLGEAGRGPMLAAEQLWLHNFLDDKLVCFLA